MPASEEKDMSDREQERRVILVGMDGLQLCQVQRFAAEGCLPHFERLLRNGAAGELLPELPAWTPTNWGTIATGALPGSTMLAGWHRRRDDDLAGEWDVSTFSSRACPVDTIWEAAEGAGVRTFCVFHPLTWPPRTQRGMVAAPLYSGPGIIPLDISKGRVWSTALEDAERIAVETQGERFVAETGIAPSAIELAKEFNFGDKPADAREKVDAGDTVPVRITFEPEGNRATVEAGGKVVVAERGAWTEWVTLDFGARGEGTVRFYLYSCAESGEAGFTLAHSSVYPVQGFTHPEDLAADLVEHVGPFLAGPLRLPGDEGDAVWLGDYEYQGMWMARAARRVLETRGWDLYYQHYHVIDAATHQWLNQADPEGGGHDPAAADQYVDLMRRAYVVADEVLGEFMEIVDDDTVVIVVSDHGNIPNKWAVDYGRVLEGAGLLALDDSREIVWEETRAFMIPQRISDIYVNLKSRYPKGTVDDADYEKVQEQIIDALLDLRNPDGKRAVAYALRKKDAQIVDFYGKECGDVVFVFNSFYGRAKLPKGQTVARSTRGANHGPQIATTRTGFSSDLATAIMAGPGIRSGYVRDDDTDGLWKLIDLVPTIAHVMGFQPPKDSRGGIMWDVFE